VTISSTGVITFAPTPGYSGPVVIPYVIVDIYGQTSTANERINITLPGYPVLAPDTGSGAYATPVKLPNILTNDRAVGTGNILSGTTIDLDPAPGIQTTFANNSGTFTLDPLTGDVRFVPAP
jgi:hypothetical protein